MFFNDWLGRRCRYTPERVAIVDDALGFSYTYGELQARATGMAACLQRAFSVSTGDRVACLAGNRIEFIDLYFACAKLGAILVPLNYRLPAADLLELLEDCGPKLLVSDSNNYETARTAQQSGRVSKLLSMDGDEWQATADTDFETYHARESDIAMLLYTSGTTGRPKAACITWRQIHWNALNTTIGLQLTENDVGFMNMPLYHTGGWHVLFTPLMLLGGRVILQPRFDAQRCNARIGPEGVSILFGVPTMLRMMWEAPNFEAADLTQVRFAICGGEPCPLPVIEAYQQRGVAIRQGYGLTEAGPNCFSLPAEDAIRCQGSIGFPNFFIGTRLVKDDGSEAVLGEVGELWLRGPHVFGGYWENEEETAQALQDNWLRTGDLMKMDNEGYYFVVGRKKEMYISGGENVYPAQVERVLQRHAAVSMAAVIGMPHPKWGEAGWAFCQLHDGRSSSESDLLEWCREHLAKFQCPSRIIIMEDLPVGHSGKIDKLALRQQAASLGSSS